MSRILICTLSFALFLASPGCSKEEAKKAAKEAASRVAKEYEEAKVVEFAGQFVRAVESRDLASLKRLCADDANADYGAILGCYYNAFAIEDGQGADAARAYLAGEMAKTGSSPAREKAVSALNEYFRAKGSLRTREVAGLVLVLALEAKYPGKGGKIGQLIAEKLGLVNPSKSATQPATSPESL